MNRYTYGPVPSRRLGFSLGIDIIPYKNCSFDCIYCQLGKTTNKTIEQKRYSPPDDIIKEVKDTLKLGKQIDYLTFSGSGEPTLHSEIGYLIKEIKQITEIPVAVLTNGSLLWIPEIAEQLLKADLILPTLCSASEETFRKINRPHNDLTVEKIIKGQSDFRKKFKGKIWLELMLIKGMNDTEEELEKLKTAIERIKPDRIDLNTVVRPPSEEYARPLSFSDLERIKKFFGGSCEIVVAFKKVKKTEELADKENAILGLIKRRPVTLQDICGALGLHQNEVIKCLEQLEQDKKIKLVIHQGLKYYEAL
ncbi:MAG TPA: radical SAM protein [candidate division WOR-3 bacterium]|uniref:Radical SAM protein n=1 Tax=candidate division WOR-3 bacterium TaxID=2052148 RepID=A0A9C9ENT5_UNCW3|nr:radical SAM protein [candidate division WOR-3 bacterium]